MRATDLRDVPTDSTHRYHRAMKQIRTRVPDALHTLARAEAAARGVSLNEFVTNAIEHAIATGHDGAAPFRARAAAHGLLASTPPVAHSPGGVDAAHARWTARQPAGAGDAVVAALLAERHDGAP